MYNHHNFHDRYFTNHDPSVFIVRMAFIEQVQPQALVLVGMLEETGGLLADWPKWIKPTASKPLVAFAGRAFVIQPELKDRVPGIYLGDTIQAGLARLEEIVR